jgi:hypothetical protein
MNSIITRLVAEEFPLQRSQIHNALCLLSHMISAIVSYCRSIRLHLLVSLAPSVRADSPQFVQTLGEFSCSLVFLMKDYNTASISTSGSIRPMIAPEFLDSKPRIEVKKQTRKYNHYDKEKED